MKKDEIIEKIVPVLVVAAIIALVLIIGNGYKKYNNQQDELSSVMNEVVQMTTGELQENYIMPAQQALDSCMLREIQLEEELRVQEERQAELQALQECPGPVTVEVPIIKTVFKTELIPDPAALQEIQSLKAQLAEKDLTLQGLMSGFEEMPEEPGFFYEEIDEEECVNCEE